MENNDWQKWYLSLPPKNRNTYYLSITPQDLVEKLAQARQAGIQEVVEALKSLPREIAEDNRGTRFVVKLKDLEKVVDELNNRMEKLTK